MRMRAAVLRQIGMPAPYAQSRPLSIEEVELDGPGHGEILVRIHAAGLCHSDLSAINGDRPWPLPIVLGHEAAAEVVELGEGVDDLAVGDHVALVFRPGCGTCARCAVGRPALCIPGGRANNDGALLGGHRRLRTRAAAGGGYVALHHHLGCAAFAEYATVSRRSAVRIDPELAWEEAALFGCAVITGAGAVVNTAGVSMGSAVAVVGLGGVGFSALLAALAAGARTVIAVDRLPSKLAKARELGATHCFEASSADIVAEVKEATDGGVDFAFEMAGSVDALELAYRLTCPGGTTVTAGLPNPNARWSLQAVSLIAEERTVKGSYLGSCVPARDISRFVALYRAGKLPVDRLLSEQITLDEIHPALDRLARGESIRQVIRMDA
ncbi:MAG: zinc-dependent alcohol dehydrogenase family protein [Burkholderiaceae bacterium]|nr:zinc-dependent alcohol dehydrogenase family protein [Burkholderiaceae bacterium]